MKETKNAIIYVRVSSLEQVDGTSLESQERLCKEYAQKEGLNVLQVYIEKGESAKTANRTEFIKAVSFCSEKKNKVSYFIVYKIDRFSRNQTDYAIVKQKLKKYGTEIRSVSEKIDDTPSGKLMEIMLSGFAEFDNNVRTERSVNGMKERLKQGIWVWQAPLGYCRTEKGGNLVPDPKLAPFIKMAFEEYAKGTHTFDSLAKFLNERGFVSRFGKPVILQMVEKIIKNPLYCGIMRIWDTETKGTFEPIIDENLFYLCQKGGKIGRSRKYLSNNESFPLRRLAVCQFCNDPLTGSFSTGCKGKKYAYYHHHKQNCDYAKSIPKEHFEQMFVEYLNEINPSLEYEEAFKAIVMDIWKNNCKGFNDQNKVIRKEIEELEQQKQRVFELHQLGVYDDHDFIVQKNIVSEKIAQKKLLIHDKAVEEFNMEEALEFCFNTVRNSSETWRRYANDPERRLQFQNFIFKENVSFSGEKFETTELTPIYSIYQQYLADPSQLVTSRRIELRLAD
jgi:site-specific DNA recombinase